MTYKMIVTGYAPEAKKMAAEGWGVVMFSVTNSCKAILVFRVP